MFRAAWVAGYQANSTKRRQMRLSGRRPAAGRNHNSFSVRSKEAVKKAFAALERLLTQAKTAQTV